MRTFITAFYAVAIGGEICAIALLAPTPLWMFSGLIVVMIVWGIMDIAAIWDWI